VIATVGFSATTIGSGITAVSTIAASSTAISKTLP
jgi:hypothetical protein